MFWQALLRPIERNKAVGCMCNCVLCFFFIFFVCVCVLLHFGIYITFHSIQHAWTALVDGGLASTHRVREH